MRGHAIRWPLHNPAVINDVESTGTKDDEVSAVSVGHEHTSSIALEELMTAGQVAALLMLPVSTVKDYARRGVLPSIKLGKHRRFVRSQMEATIDARVRR